MPLNRIKEVAQRFAAATRPYDKGIYSALGLIVSGLVVNAGWPAPVPQRWDTAGATRHGVFVCPLIGKRRIELNPAVPHTQEAKEERRLTVLHEATHALQADRAGICWWYNVSRNRFPTLQLADEAEARCAEMQQRLAWNDRGPDAAGKRYLQPTPRQPHGQRQKSWDDLHEMQVSDLAESSGNYRRIAELGEDSIRSALRNACGPIPRFPARDVPIPRVPGANAS